MEDDTTTVQPDEPDAGTDPVQPDTDVADDTAADDTTTQPSDTDETTEPAEQAPDTDSPVDDKLRKFAASQGIELDSPNAVKAAQVAMKAQSAATKNYRQKTELEQATSIKPEQISPDASTADKDSIRLRSLELKYEAATWKQTNPDKAAYEPQMVELLTSDPNKLLLVQQGALTYDDVYAMARGRGDNTASVKSQGATDALKSLAHKQQAAVPRGNATTSGAPKQKPFSELSIAEMEKRLGKVRR